MTVLSPADRARLAERLDCVLALVERPGSAGERQAAQEAIGRLIASNPGFWRSRLTGPAPAATPVVRVPNWRDLAQQLAGQPGKLRAWEREFVPSVLRQQTASRKQIAVIRQIAERVLGAA